MTPRAESAHLDQEQRARFEQLMESASRVSTEDAQARELLDELSVLFQDLQSEREQAQRREARYRALHEVSVKLTDHLDLTEVLGEVLDQALTELSARDGSVMLLEAGDTSLSIAVARGLSEEVVRQTRVALGEGIAGYVAQTGQSKNLARGVKDRYSQTDQVADEVPAALCVPLKTRNRVIGVLNVRDQLTGEDFTEDDRELLTMLAAMAAQAIENSRLFEEEQRHSQELQVLYQIGLTITSSRDRDQTLQRLLEEATRLLSARKGSVMLLNARHDTLDIAVAHGLAPEVMRQMKPRLGEGIAGYVAMMGQPKILKAGHKDRYSQRGDDAGQQPAALCVPLVHETQTLGVLNVSDREDGGDFSERDLQVLQMLAQQAAVAIHKAIMYQRMKEQFNGTVNAMSVLLDSRDPYTNHHSGRVAEYSRIIARRMGCSEEETERVWLAGLLHDIGKIGVSENVLRKPGRLTDEEYGEMKLHPVISYEAMKNVPHAEDLLPAIRHHHEHYAAGGYPDNLAGDRIPLWARILCVADTFDAMTSDRPYRKGLPLEVAVGELRVKAGIQFDPKVISVFCDAIAAGELDIFLESD